MLNNHLILTSFYFFFGVTILTKIALLLLNIKNIKKHSKSVPKQYSEIIGLEDHQKAQSYTAAKNNLSIVSILLQSIILLCWIQTPLLRSLVQMTQDLGLNTVMTGVCLIFAFSFINSIIEFPIGLYSTFVIEENYGFNKMTPALYIKDLFKNLLISILIGLPFLYAFIQILYGLGQYWWLYSWVFILVFQFTIIWAYPKFIAPFFNKFTKLDDEELKKDINELSKRSNIHFKDYFVMNASIRSSHGNAYFTGFAKNKRIVFFDTLLKTLESSEVIAVLAHELGHLHKKHILKSIVSSSIFLFIGLYILGVLASSPEFFKAFSIQSDDKYTALLLFMLIVPYYTYLMTPISSWFSRKNEFEADEFAATHASAKSLISALLKMYKDNSSTLTPHPYYSKFYYSHPPADERIEFLNKFDS
jgi:STE24 endopeptidase